MNKHYELIVGHDFSLANETDHDPYTDYSPGIWAIGTQKRTMKYAREILASGNTITVTDYENPAYHALANKFIKELGLSQPLFQEPEAVKASAVTNGKPSNLSQLKKYVTVGMKLRIKSRPKDGAFTSERQALVIHVQGNAITTEKGGIPGSKVWLYWNEASAWTFDNEGATQHYVGRYDEEKGKMIPALRIEYI